MRRFKNALERGSKWKCTLYMHIVLVWMVQNASNRKQLWCHMYHMSFTQVFFATESIYQSTIIECFSVKASLVWKLKTHQNGILDANNLVPRVPGNEVGMQIDQCDFSTTTKTHTFENALVWKGPSCLVYYRFLTYLWFFYLVHICVFSKL